MSDHLFGSITLPPDLHHLVDIHRFHLDRGMGNASMFDGWRAFLGHLRRTGPAALVASAGEHLEHFGDNAAHAVAELIASPSGEVVSLGLVIHSLLTVDPPPGDYDHAIQPAWLLAIGDREIVGASVRDESPHGAPTPWVLELDVNRESASCVNVWINPDGSLYQLYPSDEPLRDVQAFLSEINHRVPNRPFMQVSPNQALGALRAPADHADTAPGDRAMLHWLLRSAHSA